MEVHWSVSISAQRETLSQPRIDDLRYVETTFDVVPSIRDSLGDEIVGLFGQHGKG
jgi:hypothetical protein